jgi:hypothetical protein
MSQYPPPPPGAPQPEPVNPPYPQYPASGYGYPSYPHQMTPASRDGLGTASLVLGIISVPTLILCGLGLVVGGVGLGVGVAQLGRIKRGEASNKTQTWWGIGLSLASLVLGVLYIVVVLIVAATSDSSTSY